MIDFVRHRYLFFIVSLIAILPGVISLILPGGLHYGIDFTAGSILTLRFRQPTEQAALRQAVTELGHPEAIIQRSEDVYLIRTLPLRNEVRDAAGNISEPSERQTVEQALTQRFGAVDVLGFDTVSPIVATEIIQRSILAVLAACGGILLYMSWAFRKVKSPWRYGACAVAALVHDALFVLGVFSILGRIAGVELDALFITAVLTVIGFSVHDTIVVFDRVRENVGRYIGESFETVVNHSLTQTIGRSMNTSITVMLVLVALLLFGGVTIRTFVLALLIGIISGTYSSIFNASMLLVIWENGELGRWFRRGRPVAEPAPA